MLFRSVATGRDIIDEIANSGYCDDHIVYANSEAIATYPGKFYLIPQDPHYTAGAIATYLAAFDGHKEIFILGANSDLTASNSSWQEQIGRVIDLYRSTQFVAVGNHGTIPEAWYNSSNFKSIDYKEFLSYCDC